MSDKQNTINSNNNETVSYVKRIRIEDEVKEQEVLIKTKRLYQFAEKYLTIFQGEFMEKKLMLGDFKDVFGQKTELLFYLMFNMGSDNCVHLKQATIAKDLKINKGNLSRYIKEFKDAGLIDIREGHVAFNNKFIYKGKVKNHASCDIDN